jgi:hypothetical protein
MNLILIKVLICNQNQVNIVNHQWYYKKLMAHNIYIYFLNYSLKCYCLQFKIMKKWLLTI